MSVAKCVYCCRWAARLNRLMLEQMKKRRHCTILYATETGHSETYAKMLLKLFGHAFKCDVRSLVCMVCVRSVCIVRVCEDVHPCMLVC